MRLRSTTGFSLIELMVTIAVVAILLAVAFPSFEGSMRSNRVAAGTNELIASFALARTEAMRSPGGAVICTSTDGATCGGTWGDGWIVWIDNDGNDAINGADRVVRAATPNDRLVLDAEATAGSATEIHFDSRGRVRNNTPTDLVITLEPGNCPSGQELVRTFALTPTGRLQSERGDCE